MKSNPIVALRLGSWLDPDHRGQPVSDDHFVRAIRPAGEDEIHYAAGIGLAFKSFQLDLGVDLSALIDTASISVLYSF